MDLMNYLSTFENISTNITLYKVNKNIFGSEQIELTSKNKICDYLISPLEVILLQINTDLLSNHKIYYGDIIIVERTKLRVDGLAVVQINGELRVKEVTHDREFNTTIKDKGKVLTCDKDFNYFGTITYTIKSEEDNFVEIIGDDLFKIY